MPDYIVNLPRHPWEFAFLFTIVGCLIGGLIGLLLNTFAPETRNFFFSVPDRWRTMSRNSAIVHKQRLDALRGNSYELLLFIMISLYQGLFAAGGIFLGVLVIEAVFLHLGAKFVAISSIGIGMAALEGRLLRLGTTLSDLWQYDKTVLRLNRWIEADQK